MAVEAPLELRLNGYPFAVIMRTPGTDADLAAGFLFAEGVVRSSDDIQRVEPIDAFTVNVALGRSRAEVLPQLLELSGMDGFPSTGLRIRRSLLRRGDRRDGEKDEEESFPRLTGGNRCHINSHPLRGVALSDGHLFACHPDTGFTGFVEHLLQLSGETLPSHPKKIQARAAWRM